MRLGSRKDGKGIGEIAEWIQRQFVELYLRQTPQRRRD